MEVRDPHQLLLRLLGQRRWDAEIFEQVVKLLGRGLEVILVHVMPHPVDYHHLEPALHLRDHQFLVQTFLFGSDEDLRDVDVEENVRKTLEPP